MAALGFLLVIAVVAVSLARESLTSDPCSRVIGADTPSPKELNQTFRSCRTGSVSWNFPLDTLNVTIRRPRRWWPCMRLCFKVPFYGAQMTVRETGETVFKETFTTTGSLGSLLPAPKPRCLETTASQFGATIHANPDLNAYVWKTSFVASPCTECERCQGEALVELYRRSSYAAIVKVTNVLRTDDVVKVSFTLNKYFSRGKGRGSITNDSMLVTTDTCNKMLRSGKKYGLLYSPSDDSQYTFCDVRRVRTVVRTIKPTKAPIQPTTEVSTAKATTESEVTTTSSTNLEATATATVVEENTTDPSSEFETTTTTTRIPSVVIETSG